MTEPVETRGAAPAGRSTPGWLAALERTVGHPLMQLTVALVLIVTTLIEISQTFADDFASIRLRAAHGLLVVGVWQLLRGVPDLVEGLERYLESRHQEGEGEG
jgi:hypothetical protein